MRQPARSRAAEGSAGSGEGASRGWAAVGLLFGLTDAAAAARRSAVAVGPEELLGLAALGAAAGVVVAALGGVVLSAGLRERQRAPWVGFVGGAAALVAADLSVLRLATLGAVGLALGLASGALVAAAGARLRRGPTRPRLLFGLALIALLAVRSSPPRAEGLAPAGERVDGPDAVLITVDGLRGELPLDAEPRPMPVLEQLMEEGIAYRRAFTPDASWRGGLATILGGQVPWSEQPEGLPLAPTLHALGWRTGAFPTRRGKGAGPSWGFAERREPGLLLPGAEHTLLGGMLGHPAAPGTSSPRPARDGVEAVLGWLDETDGAALAWLHVEEPRAPFVPPPPWDEAWYQGDRYDSENTQLDAARASGELPVAHRDIRDPDYLRAAWTGELATVDAALGEVVEWARAQPRPPLVVVVGTAGMPLGAEGRWVDPAGLTAPPASQVTLVVWWPGIVPAGAELGAPVSLVDVGPTICALLVAESGQDQSCPPAGRLLPRAVDGAGLRAAVSTQGADGVGARHTPRDSERITASGERQRWTGEEWSSGAASAPGGPQP